MQRGKNFAPAALSYKRPSNSEWRQNDSRQHFLVQIVSLTKHYILTGMSVDRLSFIINSSRVNYSRVNSKKENSIKFNFSLSQIVHKLEKIAIFGFVW